MSSLIRLWMAFTILATTVVGSILPACAQDAPTPAPSPLPEIDRELRTFWDKKEPSRILIAASSKDLHGSYMTPPRNLREWATLNNAVIRPFGGITAIARRTKTVYSTKLGAPDFVNFGYPSSNISLAIYQLLASLSTAQWHEIASPQGLGISSLSSQQQEFWERSMPKPFAITRFTAPSGEPKMSMGSGIPAPLWDKTLPHVLTDAERRKVRLRVKLIGQAAIPYQVGDTEFPIIEHKNTHEYESGKSYIDVDPGDPTPDPPSRYESEDFYGGQSLEHTETVHAESLPVALEAKLNVVSVSLPSHDGDNSFTVGELLDLTASISGVKLYADTLFRRSPVTVVHVGKVRADSLLRALLFAKAHAVRVLPPVHSDESPLYVIAPEKEPMGRLMATRADWMVAVEEPGWKEQGDMTARFLEKDPLSFLQFDADDPMALPDVLKKRVFTATVNDINVEMPSEKTHVHVPFSELPVAAQAEINKRIRSLLTEHPDLHPIKDSVAIDCRTCFSYVVPGSGDFAGEIDIYPDNDIDGWVVRPRLEATGVKGRTLLTTAETGQEAREWVGIAKQSQAKELWLQAKPEIIAIAVQEAGALPIRAVISSLRSTNDNLPREENIYGKKSKEWLRPDSAAVISTIVERIHALSAVQGIAGIVLRGWIPPGYRGFPEENKEEGVMVGDVMASSLGFEPLQGFTLEHRRAYVEQTGQDPADIVRQEQDKEWYTWRRAQMTPYLQAVREALGNTSLLMEGEASFAEVHNAYAVQMETFVSWNTSDAEPPFLALFRDSEASAPVLSTKVPTLAVVVGNPHITLTPEELLKLLKREDKPETTIWDLTDKSVPGVPERIRALKQLVKE